MKLRPEPFQPLIVALVRVLDNCAELYLNPREEQGPPSLQDVERRNSVLAPWRKLDPFNFNDGIVDTSFGIDDWDDMIW